MQAIIELTKDDDIRALAAKDTIRAGHDLLKEGEAVFGVFRPDVIEAKITDADGTSYATRLNSADGKLSWQCSCDSNEFCKHLVATALDAQREGRGDIYKAAGIIIKGRRMLVERSVGKPAFIAPGGRIQDNETPAQALVRELAEEFTITVDEADLKPFGKFSASAANHPGQQVHMDVFFVTNWQGEIKPNSEVEEIRWLSSKLPNDIEVGSIFGHEVLPMLKSQGLVD